jgi:hypothetical protein
MSALKKLQDPSGKMKVNIEDYQRDIIPVYRWQRSYEIMRSDGFYLEKEDYTWYDKIIIGFFEKLENLLLPLNSWANDRKRKIEVRVDDYDVWGADHTLALIIHPVLVKLKEKKHGSPCVDDEDVPYALRFVAYDKDKTICDMSNDDKHQARWEWILDEMIWAFEQHTHDDCNINQFYHHQDQLEITFEDYGENGMKSIVMNHQKDPTKPAYWVDEEGRKKHYDRIAEGRRLFAKYYDALWD